MRRAVNANLACLCLLVVPVPSPCQAISSVLFFGSPADPIVVIMGQGFLPRPSKWSLGFSGYSGYDYGTALYIRDSQGPTGFEAGFDDPSVRRHDYIGLVISTYNDNQVSFTLGSNYKNNYYPGNIYRLNEGDRFTVYVRDQESSGTVHYRTEKVISAPSALPEIESAASASPPQIRTRVNPKDSQVYVWIPPGTFTMGCSPGDNECNDSPVNFADAEVPPHRVTITEGFWMGRTTVNQDAFQRITGMNRSHFKSPKLPAEAVSWNAAASYCQAVGMRLPTEAEWEYAARAGSTASRYGDIDEIAWYAYNSGNLTHEGMQKHPNAWGLYDMLGNVWQWTSSWASAEYSSSPEIDPQGPPSGQVKILRGGGFRNAPKAIRVSLRLNGSFSDDNAGFFGFRCAGTLPGAEGSREEGDVRTVTPSAPAPASAPEPVNGRDGQRYVWIPAGTFSIGCSPDDTECLDNEKPAHAERIATGFYLGETEVTQAAFRLMTGHNPSSHFGDRLPVENVSWTEAASYCAAIEGRLPAEAEWEYAARAGTVSARYGELDSIAWYDGNSQGVSRPVAQKQPNAFGLYDMLGSMSEWTGGVDAGVGAKVVKGGSRSAESRFARASYRTTADPSSRDEDRGFRCAMQKPKVY